MTRFEQKYYADIESIAKALDRIADALESGNYINKESVVARKKALEQEAHNVKHAFTGMDGKQIDNIPGFEGTLDALDDLCNVGTNPKNDPERDKFENDILDRYKDKIKEFPKSDDQANEDAIELDFNIDPIQAGDYDLRETARMYTEELAAGNFRTKKDAILDYVTNEFGSHGARYTDIIKFAYYLNNPNSPKFGYDNRGYYACAMTHNRWGFGHLVTGGRDFFVKGINKEGNERYFAHSFVESVTDYWKFCDNTKK
jgi:hypothetical protein